MEGGVLDVRLHFHICFLSGCNCKFIIQPVGNSIMICSFCRKSFDEEATKKECANCSMFGACKKTKCPHCGYEMPQEAALIKFLKKHFRVEKKDATE